MITMERFEKKVKNVASKIRLKADERRALRERVLSYMEYHPLPAKVRMAEPAKRKATKLALLSENFFYIQFKSWQISGAVGALAVLLVVGVPFAAENTVPGDVLYPVKVRVNEEVYSQLSLSSYEKVAWETRRVERRIAEARLLAKEGKLTNEAEAEITENVKEHTANAQKELAQLRENDADEAAVAQVVLESAFDVQSAVLDTDHASSTEGEEQIRTLASTVRDARASLTVGEQDVPSLSSYERFAARVEESTTRAQEYFLSLESSLDKDGRTDIKRRLEDIDRRIIVAHGLYGASSTGEAIDGLKDALRDTQKLISFMTDIDVRYSVSVETLVPKELTAEERRALAEALRTQILKDVDIITVRAASSTDEGLSEKITIGLSEIAARLAIIDEAFASGTAIEEVEAELVAAEAMVQDLLALTAIFEMPILPLETPEEVPSVAGTTTDASTTPMEDEIAPEELGA